MLPLSSSQQAALAEVRRKLPELRLVLVGASALQCHVDLDRATYDIDLAVVTDADEIGRSWRALGWRQSQHMAHRWQHPNGTVADVLPASAALLARGAVEFDGVELSLVGFDLALAHTEPRHLDDGSSIEVAALPGLAVLKIISWLDRPQERQKDLGDFARILEHALSADDDRRWEPPLGMTPFDDQSALHLGYEVARIVRRAHIMHIENFLKLMGDRDGAAFGQLLHAARSPYDDAEAQLERRLRAFARGLGIPPSTP